MTNISMAAVINWLSLCFRLDLLLRQSVGCTVHMIRCKTTTAAQQIDLVMSIKGNATSTCEVSKTAQSINGKYNRKCELLWGLLRLTHNFLHFSHVHVTTPKSFFSAICGLFKVCLHVFVFSITKKDATHICLFLWDSTAEVFMNMNSSFTQNQETGLWYIVFWHCTGNKPRLSRNLWMNFPLFLFRHLLDMHRNNYESHLNTETFLLIPAIT